ncbi:MAG: tol-pal system protein YbgF [Hyphomicrobiales bacterium]|nr:tol-pal system protein YbgF [Hyphomicrobiales bacterium]
MKTRHVLLLSVCVVLVSSFAAAIDTRDARAQSREDWQALSDKLTRMESEVAALRANVNQNNNAEAFQRLARLEQLLRENTGLMETLTFRLGQLQQSSAAYRRDVELRFQILEDDLLATSERLNDIAAAAAKAADTATAAVTAAERAVTAATAISATTPASNSSSVVSAPSTSSVPSSLTASPDSSLSGLLPRTSTPDFPTTKTFEIESVTPVPTGVTPGAAALGSRLLNPEDSVSEFFSTEDDDSAAPQPIDALDETLASAPLGENEPKPLSVIPVDGSADSFGSEAQAATPVNPDDLYREGFALLEQSDFDGAQTNFQHFIGNFPDHENAANASYWVGEIHLARGEYAEAARNFLNVRQTYSDSDRAADSMLKLGVSLRFLEQPENACGVFEELLEPGRFPDLSDTVRRRAELEQQLTGC